MLLSILILTHNRPTLFKRCISSVIDNFIESQFDIEVIVNNDTRDITEVYDDRFDIRYMYECDNDLHRIYELLYHTCSNGSFIYLEDDDYLLPEFFQYVDLSYDVNFIEYQRASRFTQMEVRDFGLKNAARFPNKRFTEGCDYGNFTYNNNLLDFQLTQLIPNKSVFTFPEELFKRDWRTDPEGDEDFLNAVKPSATMKYIKSKCYVQTTDGNDNITFSS